MHSQMFEELVQLEEALRPVRRLTVYKSLKEDPVIRNLAMAGEESGHPAIYDALTILIETRMVTGTAEAIGLWEGYLFEKVIYDDNVFTRHLAAVNSSEVDPYVMAAGRHDLAILGQLARLDSLLAAFARKALGWDGELQRRSLGVSQSKPLAEKLKERLRTTEDWRDVVSDLADFWRRNGVGDFAKYPAFRWVPGPGASEQDSLKGIRQPDPIGLDSLVGYELQKRAVTENTERLIAGLPAQNLLLYGDRGTGKSSLVKALANRYKDQGLRIVEVSKSGMASLYRLTSCLRDQQNPFIVFIDDLSFDDDETQYKELKGLLEGNIEGQPLNMRIYVTTNRRHLVTERLSDMPEPGTFSDELRATDTVQEKLSLADRFGMTIVFQSPDQGKYLDIVDSLAQAAGIDLPKEDLHAMALRWTMWNNARSGRTARQFVDSLIGRH